MQWKGLYEKFASNLLSSMTHSFCLQETFTLPARHVLFTLSARKILSSSKMLSLCWQEISSPSKTHSLCLQDMLTVPAEHIHFACKTVTLPARHVHFACKTCSFCLQDMFTVLARHMYYAVPTAACQQYCSASSTLSQAPGLVCCCCLFVCFWVFCFFLVYITYIWLYLEQIIKGFLRVLQFLSVFHSSVVPA